MSYTCHKTLQSLDIERSQKVGDESVAHILCFTNLRTLGIFNTCISSKRQATLIKSLRKLENLPRGDFLCEALEEIEEESPEEVEK